MRSTLHWKIEKRLVASNHIWYIANLNAFMHVLFCFLEYVYPKSVSYDQSIPFSYMYIRRLSRRLNYPVRCLLLKGTMTPYTVRLCFLVHKRTLFSFRAMCRQSRERKRMSALYFLNGLEAVGKYGEWESQLPFTHCRILSWFSIFQLLRNFVRTLSLRQDEFTRALTNR